MNISTALTGLTNRHFLSLASNGSTAVLSIVTYAILYRVLPESEIGNWIFFLTMFALLDAVRTGFLQTAFIKFYSGSDPERRNDVAGSTWYIAIVMSLLIALPNLLILLFPGRIQDAGILFFVHWYGITYLLTCPFNVVFWILQGEQRFDRILLLRIINQGSFILALPVLYYFQLLNFYNLIYIFLGAALITTLIPLILGWSKIESLRHRSKSSINQIQRFGRFSMGTYLCSTIFKYSDTIIIKFMLGPAALAVYNLAQRLIEVVEIPIRSFLGTAMPAMSVAFNKNDRQGVSHILRKYTATLTLILIPLIIVMIFMADIIVGIIGGGKYVDTEAANIFRIFMLSALLYPLDRFTGITLDIIHKPQLNLVKIIISLVINIVTDIIAIKVFGNIYGVAAASLITLLFGVTFGYISLNKYLPFKLQGMISLGMMEIKSITSRFRNKSSL